MTEVARSQEPGARIEPVERAWAKVSMVGSQRQPFKYRALGMHIGYLHQDRNCHYLKRRRFDVAEGKVVEMRGEMLEVLEWCSKCSPERGGRGDKQPTSAEFVGGAVISDAPPLKLLSEAAS
jgi:hypothetical protein